MGVVEGLEIGAPGDRDQRSAYAVTSDGWTPGSLGTSGGGEGGLGTPKPAGSIRHSPGA